MGEANWIYSRRNRVLDGLHMALGTYSVYFHMVENFLNPFGLLISTWYESLLITVFTCKEFVYRAFKVSADRRFVLEISYLVFVQLAIITTVRCVIRLCGPNSLSDST